MTKHLLFIILTLLFTVSCSQKLPENVQVIKNKPAIFPDYAEITIPWNIAPLNFNIEEEGDDFMAIAYSDRGQKLQSNGKKIQWNLKKWKRLLEENKGDTLRIDIYAKKHAQWHKYATLTNYIAPEEIDPYISYRLIEPSYVYYEYITINQRDLTNFKEKVIYSNYFLSSKTGGRCINCHSYQNYNMDQKMQFHIRNDDGGTVIVTPDEIKKVNLKTDYTISAGVYPAWHPTKDIIAYSLNSTGQFFHSQDHEKVEVMDNKSDLILYDIKNNKISHIANDPNELETFPSWSPDGNYLYYVSAEFPEGVASDGEINDLYKDFRYNIYRKAFDPETMTFSDSDTIFNASAMHKSATLPRISPDGKYLLFTLGDYGNFHIWHKSSDLYVMNLENWEVYPLTAVNSPDVESYHSWSSNGSWIIFSSRRGDGSYTRPHIAYFKDGDGHKPFIVPQKDPEFYGSLFKSYNIPEFMVKPVAATQYQLIEATKKTALPVEYVGSSDEEIVLPKDTDDENFYE